MSLVNSLNIKMARLIIEKRLPLLADAIERDDLSSAMKDMKEIHDAGVTIMANVMAAEGFSHYDERTAATLLATLPKYAKAAETMDRAGRVIQDIELLAGTMDKLNKLF